jgi:glucose 1-dehydrogenase
MKSFAVFPEKKEVRLIEGPEPQIQAPGQVGLKILEVGICGTDREISAFHYGSPPENERHLIIGHEAVAQVVETGREITGLRPGGLVVPAVRRPCPVPDCFGCRAGRQDFCFTGRFKERGIKEEHGFLTEYTLDMETYLHPVPSSLRDAAVLTEPLTIAEKALSQVHHIQDRLPWGCPPEGVKAYCHKALILGAGPVGLLGAMALAVRGYQATVYSRESDDSAEARFCKKIGVRYVSAHHAPVQELARIIGNIDLVYEATGAAKISFEVLFQLGTNGVFVFTGVPGRKHPIEINAPEIMKNLVLKNQVVLGTVNAGPEDYAAAIKDLELFNHQWPEALRSIITRRVRLEELVPDFFSEKEKEGIKTVVVCGGGKEAP